MPEPLALRTAIDLMNTPSRVWAIRSAPLPSGMNLLLEIAVGDAVAEGNAVEITGRPAEVIRSAAVFFIEQILFYSEADSYRVLGVNPQATSSELRHNVALLLRWLHPDMERQGTRSLYATNVTNAWNDLKTDERRALYDSARLVAKKSRGRRPGRGGVVTGKSGRAPRVHNNARRGEGRQFNCEARVKMSLGGSSMAILVWATRALTPKISPTRLRAILLGIVATMLLWGVTSNSLIAYLAEVAPETALYFDSHQPIALLALADAGLNDPPATPVTSQAPEQTATPSQRASHLDQSFAALAAVPPKQSRPQARPSINAGASTSTAEKNERMRDWTQNALLQDPTNAQALRILAQLAEAQGDEARAWRFMQTAAQLSLRESAAIDWLMRKSLEKADYAAALYYADALLRTRPQFIDYVTPTLVRIAEDKTANQLLKTLLVDDPPWRGSFFSVLPSRISDARTPLDLLLALRGATAPPTTSDLRAYLDFLIAHKFYELAYYTWLQFLPPDRLSSVGLLYNGDFEIAPSGLLFDWVMTPGAGVTIDIVDRLDAAGRALVVEFEDGRVDFRSVMQLILLPAGTYRFTGKYKGEIRGPRGMKWRISCAGGAALPIAESAMMTGIRPQWTEIDFGFTVPANDCTAQYVRLDLDARMDSEQFLSGSIWLDELAIAGEPRK